MTYDVQPNNDSNRRRREVFCIKFRDKSTCFFADNVFSRFQTIRGTHGSNNTVPINRPLVANADKDDDKIPALDLRVRKRTRYTSTD